MKAQAGRPAPLGVLLGVLLLAGLVTLSLVAGISCASADRPARLELEVEKPAPRASPGPTLPALAPDDTPDADGQYEDAQVAASGGNWVDAIRHYSRAIELAPSLPAAYEGRAAAYHALNRYEEAIEDLSRALERGSAASSYAGRAYNWLELARYREADQDFHRALQGGSAAVEALIGAGDAHKAAGELEPAVSHYSEAIRFGADDSRPYYSRGVVQFSLGRFEPALDDIETAIALRPHFPPALFVRGVLRWLSGQCSAAGADFAAFLALSDEDPDWPVARAHLERLSAATPCPLPVEDWPTIVAHRWSDPRAPPAVADRARRIPAPSILGIVRSRKNDHGGAAGITVIVQGPRPSLNQ